MVTYERRARRSNRSKRLGRELNRSEHDVHRRKEKEKDLEDVIRDVSSKSFKKLLSSQGLHSDLRWSRHTRVSETSKFRSLLPEKVKEYFESLQRPNSQTARVPFNVNNVATDNSSLARTTTWSVVGVTANTCTTLMMMPYGAFREMQPKGYLCDSIIINGLTTYVLGPVDSGSNASASVFQRTGLALNASPVDLTASTSALVNDTILPYSYLSTGVVGDQTDVYRYRLVSAGVKVVNRTVALNRGGVVRTCQPSTPFSDGQQNTFRRFASWCEWGVDTMCCDAARGEANQATHDPCPHCGDERAGWVTWIPRTSDMAYCYSTSDNTTNTTERTGLWVWLNADAAQAQSYDILYTMNWEIAGTNFRAITQPAIHHPLGEDIIPAAVSVMHNSAPTADHAGNVAAIVAGAKDSSFNGILHNAARLGKATMPYAIGKLAGALPEGLGDALTSVLGAL